MVYRQSLLYSLRFVVVTENQLAAAGIAYVFYLRCVEFYMIRCSASDAGTASAHAVNDVFIRHFHIDCVVNFLSACFQGFGQSLCLRNRSWEAIQHVALCCVRFGNTVYNKIAGQLVRNEFSLVHECFRLLSKLGSLFDICAEDIAG